jgi:flagellar protein FliS
MLTDSRQAYLETQITTATPQRMRLLMIDGAIRFARQTLDRWRTGDDEPALESLIRCREVISELLAGVRLGESPLARQVGGIYVYLFSALTEAQQTRDQTQLAAVIRVLEEERQTWREVCERLPERPAPIPGAIGEELAPALIVDQAAFSIDA